MPTLAHTCPHSHILAHTCTDLHVQFDKWSTTEPRHAHMGEDSLTRVETESRHALGSGLQTSFLGWSFPLTLALVILMHYLEVKRTQEICIRCSIQIRTALSKPSSQRIVFQIVSTKLYCTEAACVSELRRNVSASSGLPSRFWRERGKRGISDLYRR